MRFEEVLPGIRNGEKAFRTGWNGRGLWVEIQVPDEHSKMTLPYLFLNYPSYHSITPNAKVPWFPSQTDILADDWRML